MSKLPSGLGASVAKLAEMKESSKVGAVPELDVLERESIVWLAARCRLAKRVEDTLRGYELSSTGLSTGVAAAQ